MFMVHGKCLAAVNAAAAAAAATANEAAAVASATTMLMLIFCAHLVDKLLSNCWTGRDDTANCSKILP